MKLALIFALAMGASAWAQPPPLPESVLPKPPGVYYLAATAHNTNGTSDYSVELAYTNWLKRTSLLLGWNYDHPESEPVTFTIHKGRQSGVYTNYYYCGTNREAVIPLPPPTPTNVVLHIEADYATNMRWAHSLRGPWELVMSTNPPPLTNLQDNLFIEPMGRSPSLPTRPRIWQTRY